MSAWWPDGRFSGHLQTPLPVTEFTGQNSYNSPVQFFDMAGFPGGEFPPLREPGVCPAFLMPTIGTDARKDCFHSRYQLLMRQADTFTALKVATVQDHKYLRHLLRVYSCDLNEKQPSSSPPALRRQHLQPVIPSCRTDFLSTADGNE
jgi:hypothetical protein